LKSLTLMNTSLLRLCAVVLGLLCAPVTGAGQQRDWPNLPTPAHLESFEMGSQNKLNGIPVRIQGFVSDRSISELNQWYRQKMGGQWVENKLGKKTVLGQRQGDFFVTVELEAMLSSLSGTTTKVVTAIMDLQRPANQSTRSLDAFGDWTKRLPVSSQVLSHLTDSSTTHESLHLVAVNGHSVALNAQHFRRQFAQLGYQQDTLPAPGVGQPKQRDSLSAPQEKLSFTAPNTEAVVVLGKDDAGRSTVVLIINRSKR
jgi:hypothetical protein